MSTLEVDVLDERLVGVKATISEDSTEIATAKGLPERELAWFPSRGSRMAK